MTTPNHPPVEEGKPVFHSPPRMGKQEAQEHISSTHPKQRDETVEVKGGRPIIGQVQKDIEEQSSSSHSQQSNKSDDGLDEGGDENKNEKQKSKPTVERRQVALGRR